MSKKHHGGAWKVAYADFVTAMMALFLVLWLTAQDTRIKEAVERAFRNPFSSVTKESVGIIPNAEAQNTHKQEGKFDSASAADLELLRRVTEDLAKLLEHDADNQHSVQIELSPDGLRISVFDRSQRPIFEANSTQFTEYGTWVFSTLAWEIARYRTFQIELEGHTERGQVELRPDYGPWELSSDRANATRRLLVERGVAHDQIHKVAGFGCTMPIPEQPPEAEVNRRITVVLRVRPGSRIT